MADYLLIYEGGDYSWMARPAEEVQAAMEAWGAWFQELERSGHLRNGGAALARGGAVVSKPDGNLQTDLALPEVKELIGGFSVIVAESLEEAAELAKGSPFLANNPRGKILVRPVYQP